MNGGRSGSRCRSGVVLEAVIFSEIFWLAEQSSISLTMCLVMKGSGETEKRESRREGDRGYRMPYQRLNNVPIKANDAHIPNTGKRDKQ
jgi:hypothetical protein